MKFSYQLLKKITPKTPSKKELEEKLNTYLFEVEEVNGDTFDIAIPANRYSDAASHWGIAKEIAAIENTTAKDITEKKSAVPENKGKVSIEIKDPKLCRRMAARYFENVKIKPSPKWMQNILVSCGMRPINNLVDITNYVMLEVGQPTHVFDFEKMERGKLIIRKAKKGERVVTLDDKTVILSADDGVLADEKDALDIAGIKGGKKAEVTKKTKNVLLTAGNFDGASVYRTARKTGVITDASIRFSHNLNPKLVGIAIERATKLIEDLCDGKLRDTKDVYPKKPGKKIIGFNSNEFNALIGINLSLKDAAQYLKRLGYEIKKGKTKDDLLVEVPSLRDDVTLFEDLAEDIVRLYGYNKIKPMPPFVSLIPAEYENELRLRDKVRAILIGLGFSEVYNHSFTGKKTPTSLELENPISEDKKYLKTELEESLKANTEYNLRFGDIVKVFEVGKVFLRKGGKYEEKWCLGIALGVNENNQKLLLELKGIIEEFMRKVGITEILMVRERKKIKIESGRDLLGYASAEPIGKNGYAAVAEFDLKKMTELLSEENEYQPIPKYPSVMRDISVRDTQGVRVNEVLSAIQGASPKYVVDVDLIDYYEDEKRDKNEKSLTFRIVFRADEKTLESKEVDAEIEKILKVLKEKLSLEIR